MIGAGILGHSIALKFAISGYSVALCDSSLEHLDNAQINIRKTVNALAESDLLKLSPDTTLGNLSYFTQIADAVANADLVIEAVTEDLNIKLDVLKQIENASAKHTIIASNTSSLLPKEYCRNFADKTRVLGAHFFNPPHLLPLVELVIGEHTSEEVKNTLHHTLTEMNMYPICVNKETPGFIGNRLQFALLKEALNIVREGIASPEDIDMVVKHGFGRRLSIMGPFEVFDFGGWDTIALVYPNIVGEKIPDEITKMVRLGHYGVKTGEGFYRWNTQKIDLKRQLINDVYTYLEKRTGKQ